MDVKSAAWASQAAAAYQSSSASKTKDAKSTQAAKAAQSALPTKAKETENYGKTIGEPKLSDKAADYYKQLKEKYGDMDFVLVSKDEMANAKKNAASYAQPGKTVVLIDEEKIEKMATDENYRKKYEGIISSAKNELSALAEKMKNNPSVAGFGMQVGDDGKVSFFAAVKKNGDISAKNLKARQDKKKAEKKAAEKKADKKEKEERLEKKRAEAKEGDKIPKDAEEKIHKAVKEHVKKNEWNPDDVEIISADSVDELFDKVSQYDFNLRADSIMTPAEAAMGGSIDFKL